MDDDVDDDDDDGSGVGVVVPVVVVVAGEVGLCGIQALFFLFLYCPLLR
jgi:hypothetical protein